MTLVSPRYEARTLTDPFAPPVYVVYDTFVQAICACDEKYRSEQQAIDAAERMNTAYARAMAS